MRLLPSSSKLRNLTKYGITVMVAVVMIIICSVFAFIAGTFLGVHFRRAEFEEFAQNSQEALLQNPTAEHPEMQLPKTFKKVSPKDKMWYRTEDIAMGKADISFERPVTYYMSDYVFSTSGMLIDRKSFLTNYISQLLSAEDDAKHPLNNISGLEGWELYKDGSVSVFIIQYQQRDHDVVEVHIIGPSGLWRRAILGWQP